MKEGGPFLNKTIKQIFREVRNLKDPISIFNETYLRMGDDRKVSINLTSLEEPM